MSAFGLVALCFVAMVCWAHLMMPLPLPLPMPEPRVEPATPPALAPRAVVPLPLDIELAPRAVLDEVVEGGTMVDLFVRVVLGVGGFSTKLVSVVLDERSAPAGRLDTWQEKRGVVAYRKVASTSFSRWWTSADIALS